MIVFVDYNREEMLLSCVAVQALARAGYIGSVKMIDIHTKGDKLKVSLCIVPVRNSSKLFNREYYISDISSMSDDTVESITLEIATFFNVWNTKNQSGETKCIV